MTVETVVEILLSGVLAGVAGTVSTRLLYSAWQARRAARRHRQSEWETARAISQRQQDEIRFLQADVRGLTRRVDALVRVHRPVLVALHPQSAPEVLAAPSGPERTPQDSPAVTAPQEQPQGASEPASSQREANQRRLRQLTWS